MPQVTPVFKVSPPPTGPGFPRVIIVTSALDSFGFPTFNNCVAPGMNSLSIVSALSEKVGAVSAHFALFPNESLKENQALGIIASRSGVFALLYFGG